MGSVFPQGLDNFPSPNSGTKLNEIPHAELHLSESAAIVTLQERVGVTGSNVTTTIDYELHDINHGHDHDGVNSRPIAMGPDEGGYYTGSLAYDLGYFTDFSSSFRVGHALDRFNRLVKSLDLTLSGAISGSGIAMESQGVELTPGATRVNLTGSGVSGSVTGSYVTYTIPELDYRQIIFLAENGPFEHFGTGSYHEFTYYQNVFVSTSIWYVDVSKSQKIIEKSYIRNNKQQATNVFYKLYNVDGISTKSTVEDIITYAGAVEASRVRTVY
jgi:hypothetical protein